MFTILTHLNQTQNQSNYNTKTNNQDQVDLDVSNTNKLFLYPETLKPDDDLRENQERKLVWMK